MFDAGSGRAVAAAAGFASDELAEGYVEKGQALRVQACRYRGDAGSAKVTVDTIALEEDGGGTAQLLEVDTPTRVDGRLAVRPAFGPPQGPIDLVNPPGTPPEGTGLASAEWSSWFEVMGPPEADNAVMTIDVRWRDVDDDWDVYLAGAAAPGLGLIAVSGLGDTRGERIALRDPQPGKYRSLMLNHDQTDPPSEDWTANVSFQGPTQAQEGTKEAGTLSCFQPIGKLHSLERVQVARGERPTPARPAGRTRRARGRSCASARPTGAPGGLQPPGAS